MKTIAGLIGLAGMFLMFYSMCFLEITHTLSFVGLITLFIGWLMLFTLDKQEAEEKKKKKNDEKIQNECIEFYKKCINMEILDINKKSNKERMIRIAESQYNFAYTQYKKNVERMIQVGKKALDIRIEKQEQEIINKQNDEEKVLYAELTRYAELIGNKREKMLSDLCQKYEEDIKTLRETMYAVVESTQKSEKNWGIAGGIAEGLAGPGVGVATALSVQAENERIRQQNKSNLEAFKPYIYQSFDSISDVSRKLDETKRMLEACKIKLVDTKMNQSKLLSKIDLKIIDTTISKNSNTLTIEVTVGKTENFTIFDDVQAVVDGTISADIYQDEKKIGSALLVLPAYGTMNQSIVRGMCISKIDALKPYEIKFTPYHLWGMEI